MGRGTGREVKGAPRPLVGPGQKSGRGSLRNNENK